MAKVLTFGELLLRISPDAEANWLKANKVSVFVGGAELNVATALAKWGVDVSYLTALPDHSLTHQILDYVNDLNIDTSRVALQGERIGTYYLHEGKDLKSSGVIYDRAYSSFYFLKPGDINWDSVLEGVTHFQFSAICPAVSLSAANVCLEAVKACKERGIFVALDLNFRALLWKYGKSPVDILPEIAEHCDLIMGNIWAAHRMLGTPLYDELIEPDTLEKYYEHSAKTSQEIIDRFSSCKMVANTFRFEAGEGISYSTTLYTKGKLYSSKKYAADKIINKVGSGDTFMGGLLFGIVNGLGNQETLEFATAAAYKKLFIPTDATSTTKEEIFETINNHDK
ncbi:PfkB domain protein [Pseudopedobacter saltans DSM 12145]|uniref:PfkB domain protein n=1 Tax=Pseudopedobacter saltans (strain ATCC 51119 / DSM 12145 / JCM 21818 / CCUG 39354 / LMG 10337 / NBRC 100064 / NCIMB 13643) TaxID=762903 RepID=F0S6Z7_PSESL|nr:sugar kinase [Pseudopedobacter saltans]ADY53260.1 PfkB domain protein [Pseudopedobacter saltans DSM 12145]